MILRLRCMVLLILLLSAGALCGNGAEGLNHYALVTLNSSGAEKILQERFKANGKPVFLVHDTKGGVAPGDILRFSDKAVLVDESVLQTLQTSGTLAALKRATVVRLQARSTSSTWHARASMVGSGRERKGYQLGGELLKVLEDYFGGAPAGEELVLRFEGRDLVLYAPERLLDQLAFTSVRKIPPSGTPMVVSAPPSHPYFVGDTLNWQLWGADPSEPESQLRYSLEGELPAGVIWNEADHALQGRSLFSGQYPVIVRVVNPSGKSDSLAFSVAFRENQPPKLFKDPPPQAVRGSTWVYRPAMQDLDHEGGDLRCHADSLVMGMTLDTLSCILEWSVPEVGDSLVRIPLTVRDPLGATDTRLIELMPGGEMPEILAGIRFLLPRDTLTAMHTYRWKDSEWLPPQVFLDSLQGCRGVQHDTADGGILVVSPQDSGVCSVVFHVSRRGEHGKLVQDFQVRPNSPPYFAGRLTTASFQEGDTASYTPSPRDPDGDTLAFQAFMSDGRQIRWDGSALKLWTGSPGTYSLEFRAQDPYGAETRQRVSYTVKARPAEWSGLTVRNLRQEGVSHYWARWQQGGARIGLYTNKLRDVFTPEPPSRKEWAYATVGGTLLGAKGLARGEWFWIDAGFTLRKPSDKVLTGGIYGNFEGRFTSSDQRRPWIFEFEIHGHANQAIILIDTSGFGSIDYEVTVDRNGRVNVDNVDVDSVAYTYIGPAYRKIIDDATDDNNFNFDFRLEGWMPLWKGFWTGPVFWRNDHIVAKKQVQRAGIGLRHVFDLKYIDVEQSLRMGWGGSAAPFAMYWDATVGFGYWN